MVRKSATPKQNTSPSPIKTGTVIDTMDFCTMIKEIVSSGKHATRQEWNDADTYIFFQSSIRIHQSKDGLVHELIINDGDVLAKDWYILN